MLPAVAIPAPNERPKIRSIQVFHAPYKVAGFFKFFTSGGRETVLVKITAEDGTAGWGQSVPIPTWSYETLESVTTTLERYLAPALIGTDPFDIAGAHATMRRTIAPSFSTGMPIAKAGIDLALHDLVGRLTKRSQSELWGRKPIERVTLSWTVNPKGLAEAESLIAEGKQKGYKHFNLKVAPDPKFDLELCRTAKKLAPDSFLWIDANGGYDLATALDVAPKFANIGVDVFEQPIAANRLTGFRELKQQGALPILMDEGVVSSAELMEFIKLGLLDGVAMKPARTAGLWDARKQVEILENAGMLFLGSGLTDPDIALAASLQLYGAYGLKFPAVLNGLQFLDGSYLKTPMQVEGGALRVPTGPGLGVEIDEAKVKRSITSK